MLPSLYQSFGSIGENREFPEENNIKNESELKYLAHPPAF